MWIYGGRIVGIGFVCCAGEAQAKLRLTAQVCATHLVVERQPGLTTRFDALKLLGVQPCFDSIPQCSFVG